MKKKKTKASTAKNKTRQDTTALRGWMVLSSSLVILLSLLSFAYGAPSQNWIGLIGYTIGKLLHATFGLSSYLVCIYFAWFGWRLLFLKPINSPILKTFSVFAAITSLCMLLSLLENQFPAISKSIGTFFYPSLWARKWHFHLGGAPFYYIYHDLPFFNFLNVFSTAGTVIISCSTLIASLMFLTKTSPAQVANSILNFLSYFKLPPQEDMTDIRVSPPELEPVAALPVENQPRFVKLRIPENSSSPQNSTSTPNSKKETSQENRQEMLAINPETDLKVRPSLSSKEKTDFSRGVSDALSQKDSPVKVQKKEVKEVKNEQDKSSVESKREAAITAQKIYRGDYTHYSLPTGSLLTTPKKVDHAALKHDLRRQAEVLEETLQSFGIEAKVGQINCGPTINSFEVHPSIGVKVQKIKALENDIALNMEAKSIRIIAPIPGKAAVGVEVPNPQPQEVAFKELLTAYQQGSRKFHIPLLLGKAVNGDYVMSDLTKMPHCIIAGATGSGKSVCINTIVMSILLNARPDEIKLLMVDPKKVELTPYTKLPHMLAPVITEPREACAALNWLVKEMENRYDILKLVGMRNIDGFNNRKINKELEDSFGKEIPEKMPYIVGIVDELADLMMVSSSDIETPIARIAQMARAVGIHLILATQRPSREVITGLIKANFPTRISFKVASRVNSQIVLDETGAETLLGNGDMLFLPPGSSHLVRAQGAFVRDEDINAVVQHICAQAPPNYLISSFENMTLSDEAKSAASKEPTDIMFSQALDIVASTGNASTTFLQRKLKIGYARAASLMDQMEAQGIIGPSEGSKPRKIMIPKKGMNSELDEELALTDSEHVL